MTVNDHGKGSTRAAVLGWATCAALACPGSINAVCPLLLEKRRRLFCPPLSYDHLRH